MSASLTLADVAEHVWAQAVFDNRFIKRPRQERTEGQRSGQVAYPTTMRNGTVRFRGLWPRAVFETVAPYETSASLTAEGRTIRDALVLPAPPIVAPSSCHWLDFEYWRDNPTRSSSIKPASIELVSLSKAKAGPRRIPRTR
jgi:hypothetical protein